MRRLTILVFGIAIMTILSSCCPLSQRTQNWFTRHETKADPTGFNIWIENRTDEDIRRVHFIYYLEDEALGGGEFRYPFWETIKNGDEFSNNILSGDFPPNADLSQFTIEYTFEFVDGRKFTTNGILALDAQSGKDYRASFNGNELDGFTLTLMD